MIPQIKVPDEHKKVVYEDYVVGFFDILGQREHLFNMHSHPETEEEMQLFTERAKATLLSIYKVRSFFNLYFKNYLGATPPENVLTNSNKKLKNENSIISFQGFSDTLIIYIPLKRNSKKFQWRAIHSLLAASVNILPMLLAEQIPLRGAIEMGVGTEFVKGEIYGPVLQEAYLLESEVAKYPRIVAGQKFVSFFKDSLLSVQCSNLTEKERIILEKNSNWFSADVDNVQIVDYLGESARSLYGDFNDDIIKKSYEYVCNTLKYFSQRQNKDLISKYKYVKHYYESKCNFCNEEF
jgi:hypothetical protein